MSLSLKRLPYFIDLFNSRPLLLNFDMLWQIVLVVEHRNFRMRSEISSLRLGFSLYFSFIRWNWPKFPSLLDFISREVIKFILKVLCSHWEPVVLLLTVIVCLSLSTHCIVGSLWVLNLGYLFSPHILRLNSLQKSFFFKVIWLLYRFFLHLFQLWFILKCEWFILTLNVLLIFITILLLFIVVLG